LGDCKRKENVPRLRRKGGEVNQQRREAKGEMKMKFTSGIGKVFYDDSIVNGQRINEDRFRKIMKKLRTEKADNEGYIAFVNDLPVVGSRKKIKLADGKYRLETGVALLTTRHTGIEKSRTVHRYITLHP
jgi:hypothetical protein